MPVIILLESAKHILKELQDFLINYFAIEIHDGDFQTTKQQLSNMNKSKLCLLLNCDLKPHRYELYCLVKKQESSYVVIGKEQLSTAKHDNPLLLVEGNKIDYEKLLIYLKNTLKCSTAHKKKMVGATYISKVKEIINKVNNCLTSPNYVFLEDSETRLMKMISLNPVNLNEIENLYRKIVEQESKEKIE